MMGAMPSEQPTETVIEFGADPEPERSARRRWSGVHWSGLGRSLLADRRLVPLAAVLGGVAAFASLISEWQVTSFDFERLGDGSSPGQQPVPAAINDLGALGAGYVAGVMVLTVAIVLVLFGGGPVRTYARLIGLTTGGLTLAILAALSADLSNVSRGIPQFFLAFDGSQQPVLAYGRGLWCGVFAVLAGTLAVYLSGRHDRGAERVNWSWRRPRDSDEDESLPDAPFDLSVESTKPFTSYPDDRNQGDRNNGDR
jgi:hypothetical protein